MQKIRLALIFGGKSAEHEISLLSAKSILSALDPTKYDVLLVGIDQHGKWYLNEQSTFLLQESDAKKIHMDTSGAEVSLIPTQQSTNVLDLDTNRSIGNIDVAFPILHGTYGEDGTIQGLLKAMNVAFVGVDILGSAVGMDKDVTKRLLRDAGIPIADFITLTPQTKHQWSYQSVVDKLGSPLFIKPANAGSSVGVSKAKTETEFYAAIDDAFQYDTKILIEEAIIGKEVECAVLGNEDVKASIIGEIIPTKDFYSYEAKYIDAEGAILHIPAQISESATKRIQEASIAIFKTLCCEGLARVDFFLRPDETIILNEINTMPGFTNISMYPKLWEASGIPYPQLIDTLIQLALDRHKRNQALKTKVG